LGGGSLLVGGLFGDDFAGFVLKRLPAVLLLAGDDEDLLACRRLAKAGGVEVCYVAQAGLQDGKKTQVGDVPPLPAARAARGLSKHHDVLSQGGGDVQEQPDAVLVIRDHQLANRVRAKGHGGGG
jgi:hypothetical protein